MLNMTHRDFCFWLQGYLDSNYSEINREHVNFIKSKLNDLSFNNINYTPSVSANSPSDFCIWLSGYISGVNVDAMKLNEMLSDVLTDDKLVDTANVNEFVNFSDELMRC